MSVGLIALLDDLAAIAKVAAANLDDVPSQAAKAGAKAAGVVIDDAAVTPGYVIGFAAKRELPIVGRIAVGSLRNKLLILLPIALALSYFLPWTITPLLMIGGAYLCYEGVEKVLEGVMPHRTHQHEAQLGTVALNFQTAEDEKVASAIRTDFVLSAEIMAITLSALPAGSFVTQALVLALVGIVITVAVYGVVALIVKADDFGAALAVNDRASALAGMGRALGRGLVRGMPVFLTILSVVGTAAMIWVGGGIVLHGLEVYGPPLIGSMVHAAARTAAHALPSAAGALEWIVEAAISGVLGLLVGAVTLPVVGFAVVPAWRVESHSAGSSEIGRCASREAHEGPNRFIQNDHRHCIRVGRRPRLAAEAFKNSALARTSRRLSPANIGGVDINQGPTLGPIAQVKDR